MASGLKKNRPHQVRREVDGARSDRLVFRGEQQTRTMLHIPDTSQTSNREKNFGSLGIRENLNNDEPPLPEDPKKIATEVQPERGDAE